MKLPVILVQLTAEMLTAWGFECPAGFKKTDLKDIVTDSRFIREKFGFIAYDGVNHDGTRYIQEALSAGCTAVFIDIRHREKLHKMDAEYQSRIFYSSKLKIAAGALLSALFKNPSKKLTVVGVTGTNGKTSITMLLYNILNELNKKAAYSGTLGLIIEGEYRKTGLTTPMANQMQDFLQTVVQKRNKWALIEASSHGLAQGRLEGIEWSTCVFTNLTPEHLDYHGTMQNYYNAKKILFDRLLEQSRSIPGSVKGAIICTHTEWGQNLYSEMQAASPSFPIVSVDEHDADARIVSVLARAAGYRCMVVYNDKNYILKTRLLGMFNLYNAVCAFLTLLLNGISADTALEKIAQAEPPPGRMERVYADKNRTVFIDYAHTTDALEQALRALQLTNPVRIILVFGCGGDRDRDKRPAMGKVATMHADFSILTNDNPRYEDPNRIFDEIKSGTVNSNYVVIPNRERAIHAGLQILKPHEVLLIAGKGHEDYQIIGDERKEFSDKATVKKMIQDMQWEV